VSDPWDYIDQLIEDAHEEEAYYREKDREIEEEQARRFTPTINADGHCSRCARDCHLPPSLGGCFCA
jgi:prophage tail gpP-like protein